ncbi:C2 domain-containing protein 2 isoform X2 [Lingula anatina]|uniref:C2 domain-containing protein 2 isoform X2 n=1 Tax=Lingula anatina TaxID=7574 RepID=A0A1S3IQ78_LINAN|nr:C2 domain-containing protein 2 isoform X2 [Lingula anatina]|eukprot:XP_013400223.1 C2 domain-containing protein 2 isoform X2 [Lingula anatina]
MVDVVIKLIWYRLGETAANMAEAADNVYDHFTTKSWLELDPVNVLLLWWLVLAAGIVLAVNFYFRAVDATKTTTETTEGSVAEHAPVVPEADWEWVNSAIKWFYLNFRDTTDYLDAWLSAVNEKCRTQQNESNMLVQFTGLQRGTFLPKVTSVHSMQEDNHLILAFSVSLHQVYLELQASTDAIQATDCALVIHKLKGEIKLKVNMTLGEEIQLTAKFAQTPVMEMKITPKKTENQTEQEQTEGAETTSQQSQEQVQPTDNNVVDLHTLERVILNAFSTASVTFSVKPHVRTSGIHLNFIEKRIDRKSDAGLKFGNGAPPKPPRVQDRRLLVKIIKANNLGATEFGTADWSETCTACTDPYCLVEMDYPSQKHITSVVKGTQNPFWDEHFLFDLNQDSRELKFDLYDRDQSQGEDFLGTAISRLDDLREYPSSRQIIPLTGKPGQTANVCGTITVEFLFMEPAEAQQYQEQVTPVQVSPRRRIETSRTVTPGGTHITTTTTTTEKRKDQKLEASLHESPSKIEKAEAHAPDTSNQDVVLLNGADDIAEAAIRELQQRQKSKTPAKTSTIIITSVYREPISKVNNDNIPTVNFKTESPPEEDHVETDQSSIEPSSPTEKGAKRKSLGKRFLNRLRKPRSHSVERSSNIPEKNLLKPPGRTTGYDYHIEGEPSNLRRSRSIGGSIRRLFSGRRSRQDKRDESDVEIPGEGDTQLSHKSRSLTGSLRKLFRRKRKRGDSSPGPSRESSMSRASTRSHDQEMRSASVTAQAGDSPRQSVTGQ